MLRYCYIFGKAYSAFPRVGVGDLLALEFKDLIAQRKDFAVASCVTERLMFQPKLIGVRFRTLGDHLRIVFVE